MPSDPLGPLATVGATGALQAAVFDMDGLLVDSEPLWRRAETAVFARYGVALTEELCLATRGMFVVDVARRFYDQQRWPGPGPEAVAEEVVATMAGLLATEVELKAGAGRALAFCRSRVPAVALASSSPRRLIDVVVERFSLEGAFDVLHSAEHEPAGKPDPAVFLTTASLLGADPGRCVVFEDSPAGVVAAKAAGMACVAVPESGGTVTAEDFAGADAVLGSLEELDDGLWEALECRVGPPPAGV